MKAEIKSMHIQFDERHTRVAADITLSIGGYELHVTANVLIKDFTLDITEEYQRIIEDANLFAKLLENGRHL